MEIETNQLKSIIKKLLIKANTVLDKSFFSCLDNIKNNDVKNLILNNCKVAKALNRPLCQDTGQVLVFLKLPYSFSFGYDFKKSINDALRETYVQESYRKSVVKDALFDRTNTNDNTPAIIYTDFENRESVQIDVLIKGGGAENMSFIEMFNPTISKENLLKTLYEKISAKIVNSCPPAVIGIGVGGTMDYAALLSKKALFEGVENDFCTNLKQMFEGNANEVISVKMKSSSTHIASMPVAVTINCHSNRHASCEIGANGEIYNSSDYEINAPELNLSNYKQVKNLDEMKNLKQGDKILLSGTIYGMRDMAHKKIVEMIENNESLPIDIKGSIIFYAGPVPAKDGEIIGPIGPTTSKRMDSFAPKLYDLGCVATIGKGERSNEVIASIKKNNAHYFTAQGGVACFLQKSFKQAEVIAFEELGAEALYKFEVENLPLKVVI